MRFSAVYMDDIRQWGLVDWLVSDTPIEHFSTEWEALHKAQLEECQWQTRQTPYPRRNQNQAAV